MEGDHVPWLHEGEVEQLSLNGCWKLFLSEAARLFAEADEVQIHITFHQLSFGSSDLQQRNRTDIWGW